MEKSQFFTAAAADDARVKLVIRAFVIQQAGLAKLFRKR